MTTTSDGINLQDSSMIFNNCTISGSNILSLHGTAPINLQIVNSSMYCHSYSCSAIVFSTSGNISTIVKNSFLRSDYIVFNIVQAPTVFSLVIINTTVDGGSYSIYSPESLPNASVYIMQSSFNNELYMLYFTVSNFLRFSSILKFKKFYSLII